MMWAISSRGYRIYAFVSLAFFVPVPVINHLMEFCFMRQRPRVKPQGILCVALWFGGV